MPEENKNKDDRIIIPLSTEPIPGTPQQDFPPGEIWSDFLKYLKAFIAKIFFPDDYDMYAKDIGFETSDMRREKEAELRREQEGDICDTDMDHDHDDDDLTVSRLNLDEGKPNLKFVLNDEFTNAAENNGGDFTPQGPNIKIQPWLAPTSKIA